MRKGGNTFLDLWQRVTSNLLLHCIQIGEQVLLFQRLTVTEDAEPAVGPPDHVHQPPQLVLVHIAAAKEILAGGVPQKQHPLLGDVDADLSLIHI